ncbi:MAG: STAS domain-containing protein [Candidatus Competibacteraceae bacterium]
MEIEFHRQDNATVLRIHGRLDANAAPDLDKQLSAIIHSEQTGIVLDFSPTAYVSSAGLRVLLAAAKQMKNARRPLLFCGINAGVMEVWKPPDCIGYWRSTSTLEQALAALP